MKLLWCSDTPHLPTGYAQVTRNLLSRFMKAGIDVHQLSAQFQAMDENVGWPLHYPVNHNESYWNNNSITYWTDTLKPDVVAFLCDSFMIRWLIEDKIITKEKKKMIIKKRQEIRAKTMFYFPFDSRDVYMGSKEVLGTMDIRVAMSKFAQVLVKKKAGLDSHYIPHGVDTNIYRPLNPEYIAEEKKKHGFGDRFVFGMVARNQTRKMIPNLIAAFARFNKKHPKSVLLMHCDPNDPNGWPLLDFVKRSGLEVNKNVFFSMKRFSMGENEPTVNYIYNMMDAHVLPTTGEGFGLPIIESMAVGVPNIATDYTTIPELLGSGVNKRGLTVKRVGEIDEEGFVVGQLNTHRALPSIKDMTEKMEYIYDNESERLKMGQRARAFVLENYNWEKVVRAWLELFEGKKITEYNQEVK